MADGEWRMANRLYPTKSFTAKEMIQKSKGDIQTAKERAKSGIQQALGRGSAPIAYPAAALGAVLGGLGLGSGS
jgi:hypothetical protein